MLCALDGTVSLRRRPGQYTDMSKFVWQYEAELLVVASNACKQHCDMAPTQVLGLQLCHVRHALKGNRMIINGGTGLLRHPLKGNKPQILASKLCRGGSWAGQAGTGD